MKKVTILVLVALAVSLVPAYATDPRAQTVPTVRLQVPDAVAAGEEVTVKITITYKNSNSNSHISYVWLYENYSHAQTWVWTEDNIFNEDQFTLTYTTVLTEDTLFFVYARSTLYGSSGASALVEVQP